MATNLISEQGYCDASVEGIAAKLGVTVGSFYHHLDKKDAFVAARCTRSFQLVEQAIARPPALADAPAPRLGRTIQSLLQFQHETATPLLRHSVNQALPLDMRKSLYDRIQRQ